MLIKYTITPSEQRSVNQNSVMTIPNASSYNETKLTSDEGEAHVLVKDTTIFSNPFYCKECAQLFSSENISRTILEQKNVDQLKTTRQ